MGIAIRKGLEVELLAELKKDNVVPPGPESKQKQTWPTYLQGKARGDLHTTLDQGRRLLCGPGDLYMRGI